MVWTIDVGEGTGVGLPLNKEKNKESYDTQNEQKSGSSHSENRQPVAHATPVFCNQSYAQILLAITQNILTEKKNMQKCMEQMTYGKKFPSSYEMVKGCEVNYTTNHALRSRHIV